MNLTSQNARVFCFLSLIFKFRVKFSFVQAGPRQHFAVSPGFCAAGSHGQPQGKKKRGNSSSPPQSAVKKERREKEEREREKGNSISFSSPSPSLFLSPLRNPNFQEPRAQVLKTDRHERPTGKP